MDERSKLKDRTMKRHACSNITESAFGSLKEILLHNPLNGISSVVLSLCLRTNNELYFDI